jgi:hypothetical protein
MIDRVLKLLKIFRVELEECEKTVLDLMEYYAKRFNERDITSYVWQENKALLQMELSCLAALEKDLGNWDAGNETDLAKVLDEVSVYLKGLVQKRDYPELVALVIDKITKKLTRYLE